MSAHHPKNILGADIESRERYRSFLRISDDEFEQMSARADQMRWHIMSDQDHCFYSYVEAKLFYDTYFSKADQVRLIGLSVDKSYISLLKEVDEDKGLVARWEELPQSVEGEFIGYEILGWDCGGYHGYLCNNLGRVINEFFSLRVGSYGLIQNDYPEVVKFAEYIAGRGEPVTWIPFALHNCSN